MCWWAAAKTYVSNKEGWPGEILLDWTGAQIGNNDGEFSFIMRFNPLMK